VYLRPDRLLDSRRQLEKLGVVLGLQIVRLHRDIELHTRRLGEVKNCTSQLPLTHESHHSDEKYEESDLEHC